MINKYDVVQIVPTHKWGGSFLTVTELLSFGVQGFVQIPIKGRAYIRLKNGEFEKVGEAIFVPHDEFFV
jgi:hypothetical protein